MRSSLLPATVLLAACVASPADDAVVQPPCAGKCDGAAGVGDVDGDGTSLCLAIRGNGARITAHFGALARLLEHHGLVDGVAGGSSGSVSAFLLESIQQNPAVYACDGGCTNREAGERAAFLLKSIRGYAEVLLETDEALAFGEVGRLAAAIRERRVDELLETDPAAAVAALEALLASPELRDLVNPELGALLAASPDPAHHAGDVVDSVSAGLSFTATDATIFVRPGVVRFPGFVERLGRVGSFYAGYGLAEPGALADLLDACAPAARGRTWAEAAAAPYGATTCGDAFRELVAGWRDDRAQAPGRSRLDDPVGGTLPALVTTGVLEGAAVDAWRAARADYQAARQVALPVAWDDVGVGYFGDAGDLERVLAAGAARTDARSRKRRALGAATWRTALETSPAEPGLSRGVELADGRVSVGGWSDLAPVLVLEDLGCDQVVYVTREGGAGSFETGISRLLGLADADAPALFALDEPSSSAHQALAAAGGVWCSDWDAPPVADLDAMTSIGYDAPFESTDPFFTMTIDPVPTLVDATGVAGCTPGVAAPRFAPR